MAIPVSSAEIESLINKFKANQYSAVACLAIVVWELLVCAKQELNDIWRREKSIITVAYAVSRYSGIALMALAVNSTNGTISAGKCSKIVKLMPIFNLINALSAQTIMGARCLALWEKSFMILLIIATMILAETGFLIAGIVKYVAIPELSLFLPGCLGMVGPVSRTSFLRLFYWEIQAIIDGILLLLSAWAILAWRRRHGTTTPLLTVIARDGLLYFGAIFCLNLAGVILFVLMPDSLEIEAFLTFTMAGTSVLSCRAVLNLRAESAVSNLGRSSSLSLSSMFTKASTAIRRATGGKETAYTGRRTSDMEMGPPLPIQITIRTEVECQPTLNTNDVEKEGVSLSAY